MTPREPPVMPLPSTLKRRNLFAAAALLALVFVAIAIDSYLNLGGLKTIFTMSLQWIRLTLQWIREYVLF
jgi:hypothetical protein